MKTFLKMNCLYLLIFGLMGCVEVQNEDDAQDSDSGPVTPAMVQEVKSAESLVVSGELFVYQGEILSRSDMELRTRIQGMVPRNTEDYEFHFQEIEFQEGGVLYTLGHNIRLHADRLVATRGKIVTFPEGAEAPPQHAGRSGGYILLAARVAEGSLKVELRGEKGGQGAPGKDPDLALKGKRGRDGTRIPDCSFSSVSTYGAPGERGLPGYPGGTGLEGGASGSLEILVRQGENFATQVDRSPGKGGVGGPGGAGGEGGDFGSSGCPSLHFGKAAQGERGPQGSSGKDGLIQQVCITKASSVACY